MNVRMTPPKTAAETTLAAQFAALQAEVAARRADSLVSFASTGLMPPDEQSLSLMALRVAAFEAFAKSGLPTRRSEAWHYTDLRAAMKSAAPLARGPGPEQIEAARAVLARRERLGKIRMTMIDGHFVDQLSDQAPAAAVAGGVAGKSGIDAVIDLNGAFVPVSLVVTVPAVMNSEHDFEIVHWISSATPKAVYSCVVVMLGPGVKARVTESFIGAGPDCQRNAMTRFFLGNNASCSHATLVDDNPGLHLESQIATLGADSDLNAFALVKGGALVRRQIFATLKGERASVKLGGLSLLDGSRHADTTLVVEHAAPRGMSREFYKHIVADTAVGVYQGKVIVNPGAQKTDGGMKSQAILLSPRAVMNNKPELEIFADDVVCGHGATVGALDPEQKFYLQARGLPEAEAEAMLLEAFGAEAIERFAQGDLADALRDKMRAWLAARSKA